MVLFAVVLFGSAVPASAQSGQATNASASTVIGYYGCTHFPTGGTVCEDDGYGPIEQRPKKK